MRFFRSGYTWAVILSGGSGVLLGVLMAAGLGFDSDASARFIGSFFGSLVTVAGAVSLYFLKEKNDADRVLEQARAMLKQMKTYNNGILHEFDAGRFDQVSAGLEVTSRYYNRWAHFCDAHEAEDLRILRAATWLEREDSERHRGLISDSNKNDNRALLREIVEDTDELINSALAVLEGRSEARKEKSG